MTFINPLKQMLREGRLTAGAWAQLASPVTAEILSEAGFDWILVDLEHGPGDVATLVAQVQAIKGTGAVPLARAPWNDLVVIKRMLDTGICGLVIPYVNTAEEARAAVRACRYPPQGIRGVAASPRAHGYGQRAGDYFRQANEQLLIITQVETPTAVENVDSILEVEGLDGVFIGPMDLATNMGFLGNPADPAVQHAMRQVESRVKASGKVLGTIASGWQEAQALYDRGYQMVTLMADGTALAAVAAELVRQFHIYRPAA